jgi:hypothetical protein
MVRELTQNEAGLLKWETAKDSWGTITEVAITADNLEYTIHYYVIDEKIVGPAAYVYPNKLTELEAE